MTAVHALGSGWRRGILEAAVALASVAVVSLVLDLVDADQTIAALTLGGVAAIAAAVWLNVRRRRAAV
jgi:LPXTG-motif cell wall-anchored protein